MLKRTVLIAVVLIAAVAAALGLAGYWRGDKAEEAPENRLHAAVVDWRDMIEALGSECDGSYAELERPLGVMATQQLEQAVDTRRSCAVAASDIGRAAIPQVAAEALGEQMTATRELCAAAYAAKERAADTRIPILEQDISIQATRDAREAEEAVESSAESCKVSLDTLVAKAER